MQTDNDLERRLRTVLRQALDHEHGPDPAWDESPAAHRVTEPERRRPSRWTLRVLAVAALITIGGSAALLFGAPDDPSALGSNGWIAFGMHPEDGGDQDIWFVSPGLEPRRVIGSDTDSADQFCPAFSPDGRSLAYGDDPSGAAPTAVVVASVSDQGDVSEVFRVDVGSVPPCPVWSPTGDRIAFGVPQTSVVNPTQGAAGSEVWIVTVADGRITVLPDLLATDLEFSPDGSVLAIASGVDAVVTGNHLHDGRLRLYEFASGATRTLEGTLGVLTFTWSPDGGRIAYERIARESGDSLHELNVVDVATEEQRLLPAGPSTTFGVLHGIGPVWSPDGESIVYQRSNGSGEGHDVVVIWPDDLSTDGTPREAVVPLFERLADGSETSLTPYWVNWSPDGEYLMFAGWSADTDPLLGVVSVVPGSPSDILVSDQDVTVYPVYESGPFVPIQTWGRLPPGTVMPTLAPEESAAEPTPSPSWAGLPAGPHRLSEGIDSGVPITVTIAAPLWNGEPNEGSLCWGNPAELCAEPSGGVGLLAFEGREYLVYGEACRGRTPRPDTRATTVDELIDALANQGSRAESRPPENITLDGYPGKRIFLPMHPVDINTCEDGAIAMFGLPGNDPARYTQRLGLIEEVWVVDVDGLIVVLDATYFADTPQNIVDELRAMLASATFEETP